MKIILASRSPRRKELLSVLGSEMGFEFDILTVDTDESYDGAIHPREATELLAVRKGRAVADKVGPKMLVISSDTLVELDGVPLGKPIDEADAVRMLRSLSGRGHNVHTGIAVHYDGRVISAVASTAVIFRELTDAEIAEYVASGEPMDKAGAYGIQGGAGRFVLGYEGEFDTVVGFNLTTARGLITEALGNNE